MKFAAITLSVFTCFLIALSGCQSLPNDGIPFYLKMDSVSLSTNPTTQGINTQKITDVWVEANADNLGAYELPAHFPVLLKDDVRFVVSAGIWESGQAGTRVIYPFYTTDTFDLTATPGLTYPRVSHFRYKAGTLFTFKEDFDAGNGFQGLSLVSDTNVRYGARCAMMSVSPSDSNHLALQQASYDLPEGQEIWLELDYKCTAPFYVGYYGYAAGSATVRTDILFVNPSGVWNKLYVKLSQAVAAQPSDTYSIFFEALNPSGSSGGNVYIDNVKLVHF